MDSVLGEIIKHCAKNLMLFLRCKVIPWFSCLHKATNLLYVSLNKTIWCRRYSSPFQSKTAYFRITVQRKSTHRKNDNSIMSIMTVYDEIASDCSVFSTYLSDCPLSDPVCFCLQTTTLTWHESVSGHRGGHHAALVCSKEARRAPDTIQRKPITNM